MSELDNHSQNSDKFNDSFSLLNSITVPKCLKKFFTFMFGGKIGIGPLLNDIGGSGIALTMLVLILIMFLNSLRLIVDIKLITV